MKKLTAQSNRGFTLIELLIVIGILAVLLAITLIALNPAKQFAQANNTKRASDLNAILNAIHQYSADNRGNIAALAINATSTEIKYPGGIDLCGTLVPTYIAALPVDPQTKKDASSATGDPVSTCTLGSTNYVTNYFVQSNANNRIVLTANGTEKGAAGSGLPTANLTVTR